MWRHPRVSSSKGSCGTAEQGVGQRFGSSKGQCLQCRAEQSLQRKLTSTGWGVLFPPGSHQFSQGRAMQEARPSDRQWMLFQCAFRTTARTCGFVLDPLSRPRRRLADMDTSDLGHRLCIWRPTLSQAILSWQVSVGGLATISSPCFDHLQLLSSLQQEAKGRGP